MLNEMLVSLLQAWIDLYLVNYKMWGAICGVSLMLMAFLRNTDYWAYFAVPALLSFTISVPLFILLPEMTLALSGRAVSFPTNHLYWLIGGIFMPLMVFVLFSNVGSRRQGRTDIRSVTETLPGGLQQDYDPTRYFNSGKGMFLGLNASKKPIYIPIADWRKSHCQVLGTTGCGKGVVAGVLLAQAVQQGEAAIVIDPKADEFLPWVMASAAKEADVPFIYLDFLGKRAQWNPFLGKDAQEIEELLTAGLSMGDSGSDADFYRVEDRRVARKFATFCSQRSAPIQQQFVEFFAANSGLIDVAKKFYADLEELVSSPVVQASEGLDLSAMLQVGAVIYVRGSTRNPRILKLQKIFLLACMQAIEVRNRETARHVVMFLDEFKYVLSRPAIEALGAIRDKRAHVVVAHQSLGDLKDCGDDLTPEAVIGGVVENCAIKIAYKVRDPATADWLSRLSGTMLYTEESKSFTCTGHMGGEKVAQRTLRQAERPLVDINQLLALPNRTAVCYGVGRARFIYTSPIKINKDANQIDVGGEELSQINPDPQSLAGSLLNVD
ncbi:MAG: type IV secretory system conjugative DNA transfer family protein [Moraxellaceae bacterium]|nr:type IV secretory system conjugative DNA transfer family protein [Moraxellaceae bacterium]